MLDQKVNAYALLFIFYEWLISMSIPMIVTFPDVFFSLSYFYIIIS